MESFTPMPEAAERDLSGDGGVSCASKATAEWSARPRDLATVVVNHWVRRADVLLASCQQHQFVVDDGADGCCAGLDWAVKDMGEGERRVFRMTREYAPLYEKDLASGAGDSDEGAPYDVEVELVKVWPGPEASEANAERIAFADEMRASGNRSFGDAAYARAFRRYSAAIDAVALNRDYTADEKAAVQQVGLLCFLNRAQCGLKLERWEQARKDAELALKLDQASIKARYRRAVACCGLGRWEEAKADLLEVLAAESGNIGAKRELHRVQRELKAQARRERKMYSRAFESPLYDDQPDCCAPAAEVAAEVVAGSGGSGGSGDNGELVDGSVDFTSRSCVGRYLPVWAGAPLMGAAALLAGRCWGADRRAMPLHTVWTAVGCVWLFGGGALAAWRLVARAPLPGEVQHTAALGAWSLALALSVMSCLHLAAWLLGWGSAPVPTEAPTTAGGLTSPRVVSCAMATMAWLYFTQLLGGWRTMREARQRAIEHNEQMRRAQAASLPNAALSAAVRHAKAD